MNLNPMWTEADGFDRTGKKKVLLRESEVCSQCGGAYLSLYALRVCADHEGLEELSRPKGFNAHSDAPGAGRRPVSGAAPASGGRYKKRAL